MPLIIELPYIENVEVLFEPLADLPWAMWLDSGHPRVDGGSRDVIAALPCMTLTVQGNQILITEEGQPDRVEVGSPWDILKSCLGQDRGDMAGGAMGYFAYDLARNAIPLPALARDEERLPTMAVGIYEGFLVVDHHRRTCQIRAREGEAGADWARRLAALLGKAGTTSLPPFTVAAETTQSLDFEAYARAFQAVQTYIREGDCYQINLAIRFASAFQGHPWHAYKSLRTRNPSPYAAWLNLPFAQVLSSSPESFLRVSRGRVITRPIKGTRPRSMAAREDALMAEELAASPKDRAENLMIVDLLRNDLGKVCMPGSVRVPELFRVESYATVHHLVSTVEGHLPPAGHAVDVLAAAFPGGSITGAPKRRAMEIIETLEPDRRGIYCGSIGYIGHDGDMELNIAIRTLVCAAGQARYWAGGGLVADSVLEAEYQECLDKARALREVLESFRAAPAWGDPGSLAS